jgi:hypothetical protein
MIDQTDRSKAVDHPCSGDELAEGCTVIELNLRELTQLFDSLDPSPFHEKDLDGNAEEYIVESVKEQPTRGQHALVLHVDQPAIHPDEGRVVGDAIRVHFERRAKLLWRELRQLIRRGFISLVIGLAFLMGVFMLARTLGRPVGESSWPTMWREGLLIVGWVAMWRPLEIFLYDWWPLLGEQRLHTRLSRIQVRIVYRGTNPPAQAPHASKED